METKYEHDGIWVYEISVRDEKVTGIVVRTPNEKADILQIKCRNGMLLCRAFDGEVVGRLEFPAAIFSAVDCQAMLEKKPLSLSQAALDLGATLEMSGADLCLLFNQKDREAPVSQVARLR